MSLTRLWAAGETRSVRRADGKLRELPTTARRSNRTVPLPDRPLYALADHHRRLQENITVSPAGPWRPEGFVFGYRHGTALAPHNLTRLWTELCKRHGIRKVELHGLRHTCVSPAARTQRAPADGHGDRRTQKPGDDGERLRAREPGDAAERARPPRRRAVIAGPCRRLSLVSQLSPYACDVSDKIIRIKHGKAVRQLQTLGQHFR